MELKNEKMINETLQAYTTMNEYQDVILACMDGVKAVLQNMPPQGQLVRTSRVLSDVSQAASRLSSGQQTPIPQPNPAVHDSTEMGIKEYMAQLCKWKKPTH